MAAAGRISPMFAKILSRRSAGLALILALAPVSAFASDPDQPQQPQQPPLGGGHAHRHGPPFEAIANDLGIPVERVRAAFIQVGRPPRGTDGPPSPEQLATYTQALATAMNVPAGQLRAELEKFRRGPRQ
jgi:hypothetical protein